MQENDGRERPENAFTTRDRARECVVQTGRRPTSLGSQPDIGIRVQTGAGPPASGVSPIRWQCVALTCEVCGDPVRTTFSRPVVTTVLTTVPAHTTKRDHVRKRVVRTGAGLPASGVSPIPMSWLGQASARYRWHRVAPTCEVGGDPVRTTVSRPVVTTETSVASPPRA